MDRPTVQPWREIATRLIRRTDRPRITRRGYVFDTSLALFLALVGYRYASNTGDTFIRIGGVPPSGIFRSATEVGPTWVVACAALPLALRRRFPVTVLWIVMLASFALRDRSPDVVFYACVVCGIAVYTAAAYSSRRLPMLLSMPVAAVVLVALVTHASSPDLPRRYVVLLVMVPLFVAASGFRTWMRRSDEMRLELSRLQQDQADALRHAVDVERARIARDLHDVVTHNVSMMVIQAGAARTVMDVAPDDARHALAEVEAGGRAALSELRHVMGLLAVGAGASPDEGDDLAPQPGLAQLDPLITRVRAAGLAVTLTITGTPASLPAGVDLAAYRVVQEALTNSLKHASGASATVRVDHGPDELRVEVTDTGGAPGPTASTGTGRGLIGLRARLAVYDGTLVAGPRLGGGYLVLGTIPVSRS